jgi:glycogen synthase
MLNNLLQIIQIIVAAIAGVFVAWYWNKRAQKLSEYRYLDEMYWKLLDEYQKNPQFGDKRLTDDYSEGYRDNALAYHYFAMRAHTAMETIYDVYSGQIPEQWVHIFDYHTVLHSKWLRENQTANEPGYVARVLDKSQTAGPL